MQTRFEFNKINIKNICVNDYWEINFQFMDSLTIRSHSRGNKQNNQLKTTKLVYESSYGMEK